MKKTFAIAGAFLLLNFAAFAQIPSDANLRIGVNHLSETNFSGTVSNTKPDVPYEIQRKGQTNWISVGLVYGSETTNWTPFDFRTTNTINSKRIRVRSWEDSDGNGIADWWELRHFGTIGIDPYGNPAGDGWNNLQKFQNGMDPLKWCSPETSDVNITTESVRKTILPVTIKQETNGFALTILHPALHARYLLLVRDKKDKQWRASGYFESGTNRNPVYLHVDKKGMMSEGQNPIAMPAVKFLPDVVQPEFIAGSGEDSDGDLLPDIYEVLVTHTDPANDDTGDTGVIDAFKKMTSDGVSNFEKLHCRVDPLHPTKLPPTVELKQPTRKEILEAVTPTTDLNCELQIEVRTNGSTEYQSIEQCPWIFFAIADFRRQDEFTNFDLRISWHFTTSTPSAYEHDPFGREAPYRAFALLIQKASIRLAEVFKANLETNPPLSRNDFTNKMMAVLKNRMGQGTMELMALEDNQAQDFYGKVVDQSGQPVVGADVTVEINLAMGRGGIQKTQTDTVGLFQFTGLRGRSLNITPEKKGYLLSKRSLGLKGLNGPDTSPNNRAVYIMWKKGQGAELITSENGMQPVLAALVPINGDPVSVDLLQKSVGATGDLVVSQVKPDRGHLQQATNWSFHMSIRSGGFIEEDDAFSFAAPETGYQPTVEYDFTKGETNWATQLAKTYYIAFGQPRKFGWLRVDANIAQQTIFLTYAINPTGSRNLEPQ